MPQLATDLTAPPPGALLSSSLLCPGLRVDFHAQLPPRSFSLSDGVAGRREDGSGGWPHLYIVALGLALGFAGAPGSGAPVLHCRGCGKEDGRFGSAAPWGDLQAATTGVHQWRRSCATIIFGRRGHSVLWCFELHSSINLQASEPSWRPFNSSAAAPNVAPSSSGAVPGDGADCRSVVLLLFFGGEGPYCVPKSLVEVLIVKLRDLVVFLYLVLVVNCKPTD